MIATQQSLPVLDGKVLYLAEERDYLSSLQPGDSFRRYIRISESLRSMSLQAILEVSDTIFTTIADKLGATVVPHIWGLAPPFGQRASYFHRHPSIPEGKLLAAEIDFIPDLKAVPVNERAAIRQFAKMEVSTEHGTFSWFDCAINNFGISPAGLHLIDIEPFIAPVRQG